MLYDMAVFIQEEAGIKAIQMLDTFALRRTWAELAGNEPQNMAL